MAKKSKKSDGFLIDVLPENIAEIVEETVEYKKLMLARKKAGEKETAQKQKVLELIKAANLKPAKGNKIKFEYENFVISVTPRDELLQIKEKKPKKSEKTSKK